MRNDIEARVKGVLKGLLGNEELEVGLDDNLLVLGINSLSFVKLVVRIEIEFGIDFDDQYLDFNRFHTLGDVIEYVSSRGL